jgi:hypothetical protein
MALHRDEEREGIEVAEAAEREHRFAEDAEPKPRVKLIGEDGNAFRIIGACARAAKKAGWTPERWKPIADEMMAGDYDHLLQIATQNFEVH